jgi:hypothetical protein
VATRTRTTDVKQFINKIRPEGAAGKTVLEDNIMQPYTLKDKFNRLELIYTYCGYVLDEADKIKQITQSITHKSLYANAISTAQTRALPNAVTVDNIIEVMQEIYNDFRTQRKLPSKPKGNEVSLATTASGGTGKSCWSCGVLGFLVAYFSCRFFKSCDAVLGSHITYFSCCFALVLWMQSKDSCCELLVLFQEFLCCNCVISYHLNAQYGHCDSIKPIFGE